MKSRDRKFTDRSKEIPIAVTVFSYRKNKGKHLPSGYEERRMKAVFSFARAGGGFRDSGRLHFFLFAALLINVYFPNVTYSMDPLSILSGSGISTHSQASFTVMHLSTL